jgi:dipeptidyl aminopeptidase/acylaminoacyl peptidase
VTLAYRFGAAAGERRARAHPPSFQRLTFRRGTVLAARFASDGKTVVYCGAWQGEAPALYSVRATAPQSQKLDLPPAMLYSVSRSDELLIGLGWHDTIGYTSEATLARASLSGGAPKPVLERVVSADWAPDGQAMAVSRFVGEKDVLEYPIGHALYSTIHWVDQVRVSPDGSLVAFADHPARGDTAGDVLVVDRQGRARTLVRGTKFTVGLAWSADGGEIRWSGARTGNTAAISAVDLSGRGRLLYRSGSNSVLVDGSPAGAALVFQQSARREMSLAAGAEERDLSWLDWSFPTDLSPDGKMVLISEQGDATKEDYLLYLRPTDGSPGIELGTGLGATISPDGRFVAAVRRGGSESLILYPTGVGEPKVVALPGLKPIWACWSPDGRRLLVSADAPNRPAGLYETDLAGGPAHPVSLPPINPYHFRISPDGSTLAALGADGRILLLELRTGAVRHFPKDLAAGDVLSWSADGRSLYYQTLDAMPAKVERLDVVTGRHEPVRDLVSRDRAGVQGVGPVYGTPDGRTFVFSFRRILTDLYLVDGLE